MLAAVLLTTLHCGTMQGPRPQLPHRDTAPSVEQHGPSPGPVRAPPLFPFCERSKGQPCVALVHNEIGPFRITADLSLLE
jgi:hypothetical protein